METGAVTAMTASTSIDAGHIPTFAKLNGNKAWCSAEGDKKPYLQISLGEVYQIKRFLAQGGGQGNSKIRVMSYEIRYATKSGNWTVYRVSASIASQSVSQSDPINQ